MRVIYDPICMQYMLLWCPSRGDMQIIFRAPAWEDLSWRIRHETNLRPADIALPRGLSLQA